MCQVGARLLLRLRCFGDTCGDMAVERTVTGVDIFLSLPGHLHERVCERRFYPQESAN